MTKLWRIFIFICFSAAFFYQYRWFQPMSLFLLFISVTLRNMEDLNLAPTLFSSKSQLFTILIIFWHLPYSRKH